MTILVTGFIGFQLARKLLQKGQDVVGLDNVNDYYDVSLKEARLRELEEVRGFRFMRLDIAEGNEIDGLFAAAKFEVVINLAAQAGVRYSLVNPHAYVRCNIEGFVNVLEACRRHEVRHLIYASSSSVYGAVTKMPFSVHQNVDHPVSVYGATKKANELWLTATATCLERDFTYIDDIVEAVVRLVDRVPAPNPNWSGDHPDSATSSAPYRIYNIGNHRPESVLRLVEILENCFGREADKQFLPMQQGDVPATYSDVGELACEIGFVPQTSLETGVEQGLYVGTVAFIAFRGGCKRRPAFRNTSYRN
jgi:UDP-glucuronate 4-epimerase